MSFLWKLNARASKTYKTIHLTQIIIGECYAVSNRGNGRRKFWYGPSVCILHTKKQRTGIYTKKRHNQFNGKILKANTFAIAFDDGCERDNRLTILFFYTHTHAKPKQDHCFVQIQQKSENILYIYILKTCTANNRKIEFSFCDPPYSCFTWVFQKSAFFSTSKIFFMVYALPKNQFRLLGVVFFELFT